jgi:hypothetical protein
LRAYAYFIVKKQRSRTAGILKKKLQSQLGDCVRSAGRAIVSLTYLPPVQA